MTLDEKAQEYVTTLKGKEGYVLEFAEEAFKTGFKQCIDLVEQRKIEGFTFSEIMLELGLIKET